jgi:hypothetical protein
MELRGVGIIIWNGKAFLPSIAKFPSGIFVHIPPVYMTELNTLELIPVIEQVLTTDIPLLPEPTKGEWKDRKDPLLKATKAKSWIELAKYGASYGIEWIPSGEIRLEISRVDKKGRWEIDPTKDFLFPPGTPLEKIVELILVDWRTKNSIIEPEE